jgi:hypothetical protein
MFAETTESSNTVKVKFPIAKGQHQTRILMFLRDNLPAITTSLNQGAMLNNVELKKVHEDSITRHIVVLLNQRLIETKKDFLFTFESKDGPDMLIYAMPHLGFSLPIFIIEAKRLPPTSVQEYVRGRNGGIERFKKESHGSEYDLAAMLGYIQEKDASYWHQKINCWIDKLILNSIADPKWEEQDKLALVKDSSVAEFISIHSRLKKKPVSLHHFWISLCN